MRSSKECKHPDRYSRYVALMSNISDSEPSSYEEVAEKQAWKDAITKEYHSIMNNDVWDIVPRPKRN